VILSSKATNNTEPFVCWIPFSNIDFRDFQKWDLAFPHLNPYNRPYAESIYCILAVQTASRKPFANRRYNSHSSQRSSAI